MKISREEKKKEALARLEALTDKFDLNPHIFDYFEEGRLYYSYRTAGGLMGSIDTIQYDERYAKLAQKFEKQRDWLVYHAIESGKTLALLYVSDHEEDWEMERLYGSMICALVHDFEEDYDEIGDIRLSSLQGALVRIG